MSTSTDLPKFLAWDIAVVLAFVVIGRDTHDESQTVAAILRTAAPFMAALLFSLAIPVVRRSPSSVPAGLLAGATTALVGLVLRKFVFAEGVAGAFPVVATAFLVGLMVAGRAVPAALRR